MPSRVRRKTKQDLYLSERYIFVSLVTDVDTKRNARAAGVFNPSKVKTVKKEDENKRKSKDFGI